MAHLLSVNVGLPRDITWRGKTIRTGIWKESVQGRRRVGRLNVEGDGQGDLAGHGGEHRAVFVYQIGSYRHWEKQLARGDFVYGQFGENFTVDGAADDEVCIGDRYRVGTAVFEVTQPRVTCYRIGIRMDHPQMAALLTASGRPGFYLRVIEEGEVGAGDPIILLAKGPERMTVADVNALLYSSTHPREQLERALRIPALPVGWRRSFELLLQNEGGTGNAGLAPDAVRQTSKAGFQPMRIAKIAPESADVISLELRATEGRRLATPIPGQFVILRFRQDSGGQPLHRCYSLSGPVSDEQYRVSIKLEPTGAAATYLRDHVRTGDIIDVSEPRGDLVLQSAQRPVVLLSAGIGATPLLAMLHALADRRSSQRVWWLHSTRNARSHAFAVEVRQVLGRLEHGRSRVWYTRPDASDHLAVEYDAPGRMDIKALDSLGIPCGGDFYLCGPSSFLEDLEAGLRTWGVPSEQIHSERFSGSPSLNPGVIGATSVAPHQPAGPPGDGPLVSFARSSLTVRWPKTAQSLLELAEACDVPVRWSCRSGVCHNCESGLISGSVVYAPEPLDPPAGGNLLICCAQPQGDVVLDL